MEGPPTPAGIRAGSDTKALWRHHTRQLPAQGPSTRSCTQQDMSLSIYQARDQPHLLTLCRWHILPPCCPCLFSKVRTLVWTGKQGKQQRKTRWGRWLSSEKQSKWTEKTKRKSTNQTDRQHERQGSWPWRNPTARQRENLPHFSKISLVSSLRVVQEMSDHFFYSALDRRFWQEKDRSSKQEGGVIITPQLQVSPWEDLRASEQSNKMEHFHHRFKLDSKPIPTDKSK